MNPELPISPGSRNLINKSWSDPYYSVRAFCYPMANLAMRYQSLPCNVHRMYIQLAHGLRMGPTEGR